MDSDRFKGFMTVRFLIPIKIVIGAAIAILVNPKGSPEFHRLLIDCITYSITICMLYFAGDYVFYVAERIYRKYVNKEDDKQ